MMKKVGFVSWIAIILVIIGGLNWGLVGFFNFDLIAALFGKGSTVSRVIYSLVGLAAIWMIFFSCKCCCKKSCAPTQPCP